MGIRYLIGFVLAGALAGAPCLAGAPRAGQAENAVAPTTAASAKTAGDEPDVATITFRKVFKGSTPEYVEIKIGRNGTATYDIRQIEDPSRPQPFQVSAKLTDEIFALAAAMHDFNGIRLEARRMIANLGEKTFSFEANGETHSVNFNYTTNAKANELLDVFETISLEDQYLDQLGSSMRYDPLGINDVLIRLQSDLASNAVAEPEALVPALKKVISNPQLIDIARERARQILESIDRSH
jgi:hypothetical protein